MIEQDNPLAALLWAVLNKSGQTFIRTAEAALRRPTDQDAVVLLVDAIGHYFTKAKLIHSGGHDMSEFVEDASGLLKQALEGASGQTELEQLLKAVPELKDDILSLLILANVGDAVVTPVFAQTDAVGTVMRRKLEPVTTPIFTQLENLQLSK